jgi:hypothetical protein
MKAISTGALLKLKSVRVDIHDEEDTCILHGDSVCLSGTVPQSQPAASLA